MTTSENSVKKKKVCIIGGGPAGLASLRWVLNSPFLTGTLFEQKDDIGGVWHYKQGEKRFPVAKQNLSNSATVNDPECTTTMYDDLTSNLPYPLMEFYDFPHKNPPRTFLTQQEMHTYLRNYTDHFGMWPNIQLNSSVLSVRPETPIADNNLGKMGRWIVETYNNKNNVSTSDLYDAVMVCVGKNTYPYQPNFPGVENFLGELTHCKYYRNAEDFRDKRIVLIGLGPSSADLALHLSKTAKSVTVCHKFLGGVGLGLLPQNVQETKNVTNITQDGVITEENEEIACDVIMFCTGYGLKFPFFDEQHSQIKVIEEKYVPNLYKMTIFTKRPSLAILNMCYRSPEITIVEVQARYFVSALEEQGFSLPGYLEMEADVEREENEKRDKGLSYSHWFQVGDFGMGALKFFSGLCEEIGIEECCWKWPLLDNLIIVIFFKRIFAKLALYKKDTFRYVSDTEWEYICSADPNRFPEVKGEKVRIILDTENGNAITETNEIVN